MNTKKLTLSLYRWAKVYFLFVLLPVGAFVGAFTVYHYIESPELFSYQLLSCDDRTSLNGVTFEMGCSDPINATSVYTGVYTPRIVSPEEYEVLEQKNAAYNLRIALCFLLSISYLVLNWLRKRGKI